MIDYTFPGQYLIGRSSTDAPANWRRHELAGFTLHAHPSLLVRTLLGTDETASGWIVGQPIGEEPWKQTEPALPPPTSAHFETVLYTLGGSWTCVVAKDDRPRIYVDACGAGNVVYSASLEQAASSTALFAHLPRDETLVRQLAIPRRDNWYPFGLSPRIGCRRLLPNHVLDLTTWQALRIWPTSAIADVAATDAVAGIVEHTSRLISVLAPLRPYLSITAGRDSRMLLACARQVLDHVATFTIAATKSRLDADVGTALARRFGIDHTVLTRIETADDELAEWQHRVDSCVGGQTWLNARTLRELQPRRPYLLGIAGEFARGYYWRTTDEPSTRLSAADLLQRLRLPGATACLAAAHEWLANAPEIDTLRLLDLLYLEQRVGCWAAPQNLGHAESAYRIFPLGLRATLALMLGISSDYKRSGRLAADVIRATWPELLDIPFNRPLGAP